MKLTGWIGEHVQVSYPENEKRYTLSVILDVSLDELTTLLEKTTPEGNIEVDV